MKRIRWIKLLTLAISLLLSSTLAFAGSLQGTGTVLGAFLEPDFHAKPMTRLWFPDAGAGGEDNDSIEKQILELAEDSDDPGVSRITDVDFGARPLGKWSEIEATKEQLNTLGVNDMKYVSGTGEYTVIFTAPKNWSDYAGAFITFEYGKDQIGAVIVNGTELTANNASDRVDVGALITEGQNEITVRLNSALYGRTYVEHSGYQAAGADYGMNLGFMTPLDPEAYYNGLLDVKIIPYSLK